MIESWVLSPWKNLILNRVFLPLVPRALANLVIAFAASCKAYFAIFTGSSWIVFIDSGSKSSWFSASKLLLRLSSANKLSRLYSSWLF